MNDVASGTANAATVSCLALNLYVGVARRLMGGGVTVTRCVRAGHSSPAFMRMRPHRPPTNVSRQQGNRLPSSVPSRSIVGSIITTRSRLRALLVDGCDSCGVSMLPIGTRPVVVQYNPAMGYLLRAWPDSLSMLRRCTESMWFQWPLPSYPARSASLRDSYKLTSESCRSFSGTGPFVLSLLVGVACQDHKGF